MTLGKIMVGIVAVLGGVYTVATREFSWAIWVLALAILVDVIWAIFAHEEEKLRQALTKAAGAIVIPAALDAFAKASVGDRGQYHELIIATTALAALAMLQSALPHLLQLLAQMATFLGLTKAEVQAVDTDLMTEVARLEARMHALEHPATPPDQAGEPQG